MDTDVHNLDGSSPGSIIGGASLSYVGNELVISKRDELANGIRHY
jgi:hypothetical protein